MRLLARFVMCAFVLIASTRLCAEVATAPAVAGWRGDGTGRYPNANPPLDWGYTSKVVKELSSQARKPKDDAPPVSPVTMADGTIHEWLVLGPLPIPEGKKFDELLPNAETLSPDENEKAGDLAWKSVACETSCLDLCSVLNVPTDKSGVGAFAHTYIHSPSGKPVIYNLLSQGQGGLRVWLNGKLVFTIGDKVDMDFFGARPVLPLKKGWNSLLVLNAKVLSTRKTWWNIGSLYGREADGFDSHGIVWSTFTPCTGSSAPVIAGDRLFFTAERGCVGCASKADGKLLWIHSVSYCDFLTEEERKANPEVMAELAPLVEHQRQIDQSDIVTPWKAPTLEKDYRGSVEGPLYKATAKISKTKFRDPTASWLSDGEAGMTVPTPATDGKFVYALFGTGIVACFDQDGNRQWIKLLKTRQIEHGYGTSPLLVDGKLVIYFDDLVILDPKTGATILDRPKLGKSETFGTCCVLPAGNDKVLFTPAGEFVRLFDGKTLTVEGKPPVLTNGLVASPVVDNGICYNMGGYGNAIAFKLSALQGDKVSPEIIRSMTFKIDHLPYYYEPWFIASPLYHDGLLYFVGNNGSLTVVDAAKGEVLYQRQIDLDVFMPYNGRLLKGGASACPTLAGKYIYIWGDQGTCVVIEPGRAFKQVARLRIEAPLTWNGSQRQEATISNPVFEDDRMYYRAESHLYCIGPK